MLSYQTDRNGSGTTPYEMCVPLPRNLLSYNHCSIRPSSIPGAGMGLFANVPIKKGQRITYFDGMLISRERAKELRDINKHSHIISITTTPFCIDGFRGDDEIFDRECRGRGSLLNDGRNVKTNNCKFESDYRGVNIKAKRDIRQGEELLVSYGRQYWNSFHA